MATLYWRGATSGDVNQPENWSYYPPGATAPPASPNKPTDGDIVYFIGASGSNYAPLFPPYGHLYGNTGPTGASVRLYMCSFDKSFNLDIGTSSNYLQLFANNIYCYKPTGNAYFKISGNPTDYIFGYETSSAILHIANNVGQVSSPSNPIDVRVTGFPKQVKIGYNVSVNSNATIRFEQCQFDINTPGFEMQHSCKDTIYMDSDSVWRNLINIKGAGCTVVYNGGNFIYGNGVPGNGFYITNSTSTSNVNRLIFKNHGYSGPTASDMPSSYIQYIGMHNNASSGVQENDPLLDVGHKLDVDNLDISSGTVQYAQNNANLKSTIFGGVFYVSNSNVPCITGYADALEINTDFAGTGFRISNPLGYAPGIKLLGEYEFGAENYLGATS